MKALKYIKDRKLEMIAETKDLSKEKDQLTQQGQQIQARLNQVNLKLATMDVELDTLDKLEVALNGHKEVKDVR